MAVPTPSSATGADDVVRSGRGADLLGDSVAHHPVLSTEGHSPVAQSALKVRLNLFEQRTLGGDRVMAAIGERNRGLLLTAAGMTTIVLAVLLFGLTTGGAIDWVSVVTAVAGLVVVVQGLYLVFHNKRTGGRPQPHAGF